MSQPNPNDEELVLQAQQGQANAFDELVNRYSLRLIRYIVLTHQVQPVQAEDIAQETWLRVVQHLPEKRPGSFLGWLFEIARNLVIDYRRSAAYRRMYNDSEDAIIPLQAVEFDPTANLTEQETASQLAVCLERLPPELRQAIVTYADDIPDEELANQLQLSPTTIRTRRSRARTQMQECLNGVHG